MSTNEIEPVEQPKRPAAASLRPVQHRAAALIAAGAKPAVVAEQCNVNIQTVRGWLKQRPFLIEVDTLIYQQQQEIMRQVWGRAGQVFTSLADDATNADLRASERTNAAKVYTDRLSLSPATPYGTAEARQHVRAEQSPAKTGSETTVERVLEMMFENERDNEVRRLRSEVKRLGGIESNLASDDGEDYLDAEVIEDDAGQID